MVYKTPRTYGSYKKARYVAGSMSRYDGNRNYNVIKVTNKPKRYIVKRGSFYRTSKWKASRKKK